MATKALTKEQRKHISTRLGEIYNRKNSLVNSAFTNNPQNNPPQYVRPTYPNVGEVLLKIAGFDSAVELKLSGDELRDNLLRNGNVNINQVSHPINKNEVLEYNRLVTEISDRREQQVTAKQAQIRNHYNRCNDMLALSNDVEYIVQMIDDFERLEV